MAISKIILNGVTQMDVTQDTVASANLLSGETATGADGNQVVGAYVPASAPTIESLSVTPSETQQTYNSSSVDGYKPVTVGAISSTYVGSGITRRSSSDMTASGATVTAPAGYYASSASKTIPNASWGDNTDSISKEDDQYIYERSYPNFSAGYMGSMDSFYMSLDLEDKSVTPSTSQQVVTPTNNYSYLNSVTVSAMPNGTAGTPTANKGTVSNHAVTVTPSVTNSAGYITGGTKTGTAVSVSASELVSGTLEINSSGTKDVTNYASVYVPQMTLPSAPSSSHTGTVRSSISWASSIRYLNVPAGYNDTARYYTLEGVPLDPITITENGTYNALDYEAAGFSTVVVNVQGGTSGVQVAGTSATRTSASSISFSELRGEPIAFYAMFDGNDIGTSATATIVAFVYDGQTLHAQTVNNQITYDGSSLSYTYNNGTLTITSNGATIPDANFVLSYAYGGTSANIDTKNVQVGSGATSITFSGLADEPVAWACIFKSNFSTSSGYQRVAYVDYEDGDIFGVSMDSSAHCASDWTASYSNGSLTISSTSASVGGYFHQPGYYQLTAIYGEPVETTIEPLTVTENGTYSESGVAYSPVVVNVPTGGGVNVATTTWTNSSSTATSHTFTGLLGTPKAAFLRCTTSLSRSSNSSNYYVADMRWTGSATAGNSYRRSNGTYANVTSGYSFSASGTSLTVTTSGNSTTNPGSFYNGTYELTYVY